MTDYKFKVLPDIATADVAYEVWGDSLNELFEQAAYAVTDCGVELSTVEEKEERNIEVEDEDIEHLLFDFLSELIFLKDAELFLPKKVIVNIDEKNHKLQAIIKGEAIDQQKHKLKTDVKAMTYHMFKLEKMDKGYKATFILDI
ncbi:MAG: archease [Candidatus Woesearchaeota archaeon]